MVIAAGSETIARTLTTATFFLLSEPGALVRLKEELAGVIPSSESNANLKNLEQLP